MTPAEILTSRKIRLTEDQIGVVFFCPGCNIVHQVRIAGPTCWTIDGTPDNPTLWPSINAVTPTMLADIVCHSFITLGIISFLPDCTHKLQGQKIPMPIWPYEPGKFGGIIEPKVPAQ